MKNPYKLIEQDLDGERSDVGVCYIMAKDGNRAIALSLPSDKWECYCLEFVRLSNHHRVAYREHNSKEFVNVEEDHLSDIAKLFSKISKNDKKLKKKLELKWRSGE